MNGIIAPTQRVMLESVAKTCTCGSAVCALVSGSMHVGCRWSWRIVRLDCVVGARIISLSKRMAREIIYFIWCSRGPEVAMTGCVADCSESSPFVAVTAETSF